MISKKTLKLFVWREVLCDYTCGVMFALAHNADEARQIILKSGDYVDRDDLAKEPEVHTKPMGVAVWGGA